MARARRFMFAPFALVVNACHASTPPPPSHLPPAPLAPVRVWSNRALRERCDRPPPAPLVSVPSAAPSSDSPPARRVELPPALARYPLLGRLSTGCGSPTLQTYCSMASPPFGGADFDRQRPLLPSAPLVMMFGDARDCVTRSALEASLDRDALGACFQGSSLPCAQWHWVSASIRIDRPHEARLIAMTGHEAVTVQTASCLSRAFRATRWVDHEGDAPVIVNVAISWTDQACFR